MRSRTLKFCLLVGLASMMAGCETVSSIDLTSTVGQALRGWCKSQPNCSAGD
ncbi:MAG: hypothetical protein HY057_10390 [Rhodospirillales bacterium]|nr:hypothetical protein [Rhodospirillales bacterium]